MKIVKKKQNKTRKYRTVRKENLYAIPLSLLQLRIRNNYTPVLGPAARKFPLGQN